ncbi:MAG: endolytic transglycosylase MltG [Pseudomonadota bacterium]
MKKLVALFLVLLVAAIVAYTLAINYLQSPLTEADDQLPSADFLLEVNRGDSARGIVAKISEKLQRPYPQLDYRLSQLVIGIDTIKAGVYQIDPQQNWFDLWQMLGEGDEKLFSVTLVEGQTLQQWLLKLQQQPYLTNTIEPTAAPSVSEQLSSLSGYPSAEGLFLPETYSYSAYTTDVELLTRAHQDLQRKLSEIWEQRSSECPVSSPYELLILASIIEKETGLDGERDLVASVFANRLNIGMRLQSDPTTIYGVNNFDGNLTRAHLREKTAYNTYRIDGLPPTPIAMVSEASLRAAAHPAESDYFYFVADKKGSHVFSKTLDEHRKAVRKYQLNQ